ncbi:MAG: hypothetical protein ABIZ04_17830 [Opitutus sp.]
MKHLILSHAVLCTIGILAGYFFGKSGSGKRPSTELPVAAVAPAVLPTTIIPAATELPASKVNDELAKRQQTARETARDHAGT